MKLICFLTFILLPLFSGAQNIITVAGTGTSGFDGDGGSAKVAKLNIPNSIAIDRDGNMFIADAANNRIRKINVYGIITTIAGTGGYGFTGDGGAATLAQITPTSIAVDSTGNIYLSESGHRIRKINTAGMISTIAGTGVSGYNGDGIRATAAQLFYPYLGGIDGQGNLIFSDYNNHRVRKIDASGIISTIAGNGTNAYAGDGGPATDASIKTPAYACIAPDGSIYIPDNTDRRVRKVDVYGMITTIAGSGVTGNTGDGGPSVNATLSLPNSVAVDADGNIYIACSGGNVIRKVDVTGTISTVAGNGAAGYSGDGGPASVAELNYPCHIAFSRDGNLFVADAYNNSIRRITYNPILVPNVLVDSPVVVLYPNPCRQNITIKSSDSMSSVQIINALGNQVFHCVPGTRAIEVNTAPFAPGVYFLRVDGVVSQKFVKE